MAIKPAECLTLSKEELSLVEQLEKKIDAELREKFTRAGMSVDVELGFKPNDRVLDALKNVYQKVGWQIVLGYKAAKGDDMRGLDYVAERNFLTFSESPYKNGSAYADDYRDLGVG